MKTQELNLFIYVRQDGNDISVQASTRKFDTTYCSDITQVVSAPLTEMKIMVPAIDSHEATKVLHGALLENLIAERDKAKAEMMARISTLDSRINDLQCLEFKGDNNE